MDFVFTESPSSVCPYWRKQVRKTQQWRTSLLLSALSEWLDTRFAQLLDNWPAENTMTSASFLNILKCSFFKSIVRNILKNPSLEVKLIKLVGEKKGQSLNWGKRDWWSEEEEYSNPKYMLHNRREWQLHTSPDYKNKTTLTNFLDWICRLSSASSRIKQYRLWMIWNHGSSDAGISNVKRLFYEIVP